VSQYYKVLGSQDIIGNPSSIMANVSKGTENFYDELIDNLADENYSAAVKGLFNNLQSTLKNTGIAISSSI
jgi:hypothetical protein